MARPQANQLAEVAAPVDFRIQQAGFAVKNSNMEAMARAVRLVILRFAAVAAISLFTAAGIASDASGSKIPAKAHATLKQTWKLQSEKYIRDAKAASYTPKGGYYAGEIRILKDLLNQAPTNEVRIEFDRICAASVIPERSGDDTNLDENYSHCLLQALVIRSIENKQSGELVTLLQHHCPRYLVFGALEFWLASDWPGSMERLFECYPAAKSTSARKDIVFCLGRAFPALRQQFPDDGEFVKQAQRWYSANQPNLEVNQRYQHLAAQPPPHPGQDVTNLFVFRSR